MPTKYLFALIVFLFSALSLSAFSYLHYTHNRTLLLNEMHSNTRTVAQSRARGISDLLLQKTQKAITIAYAPVIRRALEESNHRFEIQTEEERRNRINILNERWKSTDDLENPFIRNRTTNPAAEYLRLQQILGKGEYGEIFLTNRYGAMIATTGKLTTLAHAQKYWWQASYAEGNGRVFLDDRGFDKSVDGYVLGIVVPVVEDREIVGILKCNLNILDMLREATHHETQDGWTSKIVRSRGRVVLEKGRPPLETLLPEVLLPMMTRSEGSIETREDGVKKVFSQAVIPLTEGSDEYGFGGKHESIDHIMGNLGETWHVVLAKDMALILEPLNTSLSFILKTGAAFLILMAVGAYFLGGWVSRVKELQKVKKGLESDIAGHERLERELLSAKELAETASKSKSEFLANMSHELRTPLNGIMGMLQLIEANPLEQGQKEYINAALEASTNLLTVINDVLDISSIEAGKLEIVEEEFVLPDVLNTVTELMRQEAVKKQIQLHCSVSKDISSILVGDPGRIRQILFNLVGNAVKFTEQGEVRVNMRNTPVRNDSDRIRLDCSVSDTGIGIPRDKLQHVFEPFTQASSGSSRKYQGTGLGLSIAKRLVEAMGGDMTVESKEGLGSTFHFTIEVGVLPTPTVDHLPKGEQLQTSPSHPALKILVVEDNDLNLKVIHSLLENQGHTVREATTGVEALQAMQEDRFDCILMDIQLPEMDGMEITRRIRNGESGVNTPQIPIVALTAHAMVGDREKFLAAGMDDYIPKPVRKKSLVQALANVVAK
jgi:signal transduction histidine kinase/CheY-like chemotaxis protein